MADFPHFLGRLFLVVGFQLFIAGIYKDIAWACWLGAVLMGASVGLGW